MLSPYISPQHLVCLILTNWLTQDDSSANTHSSSLSNITPTGRGHISGPLSPAAADTPLCVTWQMSTQPGDLSISLFLGHTSNTSIMVQLVTSKKVTWSYEKDIAVLNISKHVPHLIQTGQLLVRSMVISNLYPTMCALKSKHECLFVFRNLFASV